jgi:DNA replication protein DnaC
VLPEAFAFLGLTDEDEEARPQDERILAENPVPTLWLTHEATRLHRDTLTRFLFHAEALKGTRADRAALVESMIESLPLAKCHRAELVKLEGLSAQQLACAKALATMTAGRSRKTFAKHLLVAASRSQKALARRNKDEARLPVTRYSLDYIHAAGRFGPAQILQALKRRPQGSLCLYGLPGTGKTQFAEHLAMELGKPILIKHASELFDKYVGESEKRIAEAFDQAEEDGAILLLDEADSFLRDRSRSTHSWEVSTVNELLQRMERFEEIFICTTNLFTQVDIAALRRFTFKLEFLPLTMEQRWAMFLNETSLRGKPITEKRQSAYEERLAFMQDLTPGDFATVKRQCLLLGEELSPEEWLGQLEIEVATKRRSTGNEDPRQGLS